MEMDYGIASPDSPYGLVGGINGLFEAYKEWNENHPDALELREAAHTTSDFATYLGGVVRKRFYSAFKAKTTNWREYAHVVSVPDFRTETLVGLTEFSDLLEVEEEGEYKFGTLGERSGPVIALRTYGRLLKISRKLLINDDQGRLGQAPDAMARAARRTLEKDVLSVLEDNPNTYDGNPLFHAGSHGNAGTAALSEAALQAAILAVLTQTNEDGDPLDINIESLELVVPTGLLFTARRILNSAVVGETVGQGTNNVMKDIVRLRVEPLLSDQNDWYLRGKIEGSDASLIVVAFLNGKETPDLLQRTTVQQLGTGAFDPYNLEIDNIEYKVRHDWGVTPGEYRVGYKSVVA